MAKLRVQSFAISLDGYGAGPNQDLQNPLGVRGPELMEWFFHTRLWRTMHGEKDGETGESITPWQSRASTGGRDIDILLGGGVSTVRQYLSAG